MKAPVIIPTPDKLLERGVPPTSGKTVQVPHLAYFRYRGGRTSLHKEGLLKRLDKLPPGSESHRALRARIDRYDSRAAERVNLDKKVMVNAQSAMIMAKQVSGWGGNQNHYHPRTQEELAGWFGFKHRTSVTRALSQLYAPAPDLDPTKPRAGVIKRERRFGAPNRYQHGLPTGRNKKVDSGRWVPPEPETIAVSEHAHLWEDPELLTALGKKGWKGYGHEPLWIRDPATGANDLEQSVMCALFHCGLMAIEEGKPRGWCNVKLKTLAWMVGATPKTVRKALRFWEKLGILRCLHYVRKNQPGAPRQWTSMPMRFIYLPLKMVSRAEAMRENDRFGAAWRKLSEEQRDTWYDRTTAIHTRLLRAWTGSERLLKTFWKECRKEMLAASVPAAIADRLIPAPPG